jgi:hypothetical protein
VSPRRPTRVPPNDQDAERALLGACLLRTEAIAAALSVVSADDFYRPGHVHVFDAVVTLAARGDPVDPVTVADELARVGSLDQVGDVATLSQLQADTPASNNAAGYARIVARMAVRRRMIAAGQEIAELGYASDDIDGAVEATRHTLAQLGGLGRPTMAIRSFDQVERESVEWVWQGRIPRGAITIAAGDPGVGKSYVMVALAAGLSVGAALPGANGPSAPVGTLIVSYEDAAGVTLKSRIGTCGADERLVYNLDGVADGIGLRPFRPDDAHRLEAELARRPDVGMVVIDPVGSLLAGKLDMARDNEVRFALQPLADMARRVNVAVVAVMHLRKEDAGRVIYRVGGSVGGFVGLARSVLLVCKQEASGRRAVTHPKCNVGRETESVEYVLGADGTFAWKGVAPDLAAEDMLSGTGGAAKRQAAAEWLVARLTGGPVLRSTLVSEGEQFGYSYATLRRAYDDIGADSVQKQEPGKVGRGPSYWFLPEVA